MLIGFPHRPPIIGGPGTFQSLFVKHVEQLGHRVIYPEDKIVPDIVLVIGGTRKLIWLLTCKIKGAQIVHRLDGINWRHHVEFLGYKKSIMASLRNQLMLLIRNCFANRVVYQSLFAMKWWHQKYGPARCEETIIYNGTDLFRFRPRELYEKNENANSLLVVEGNLETDDATLKCLVDLALTLFEESIIRSVRVYGGLSNEAKAYLEKYSFITYCGKAPREEMPEIYRDNSVFLGLEINAACPNTIIEAMASGLPVVSFRTGAVPELVDINSGVLADYGNDSWKLATPNVEELTAAARIAFGSRDILAAGARLAAERRFDARDMVKEYLKLFENL